MRIFRSARAWTWFGAAALLLTVGFMARRAPVATGAGEELRDAVASPAQIPGAFSAVRPGAFAPVPRPTKRFVEAARLLRLADALDAKAASLSGTAKR